MKTEMSDEEYGIQLSKIFLAFILGVFIINILWHINHNLTTIIGQNAILITK